MGFKLRMMILFSGFTLAGAVLIFRAFQLQVVPSKNVESLANKQLLKTIDIVGRRGALKDRRGRELAISVNTVSLFVNPHLLKNRRKVTERLSKILGVPAFQVQQRINRSKSRKFIWLERQLSHEQNMRLKRYGIHDLEGVGVLPEYRRDFPNGELAAQVLGYVSVDGQGLGGVERQFDTQLSGDKKSIKVQRDAKGRPIFSHSDQIRFEDLRGDDIVLSIDSALQSRVERSLKLAVEKHEADSALAIAMNPVNGELLAVSHYPSFYPARPSASPSENRRIRALTDPIEPGSVLKPFVVAEALEQKKVKPNTMISGGGGRIQIGRKVITESDRRHYYDTLSVSDLIRYSSNVGTVNLQKKIGFTSIAKKFDQLGFRETTGVELPSESRGIFRIPNDRQELEKATISYGHGIALTPLQIVRAWAAFANGGYLVKPTILLNKSEISHEKQIFSETTLKQMTAMLERVVHDGGTGALANVEGYRVAGKTGTSIKVSRDGGYEAGAYWSSFAGYFPSKNPELVIYVAVDNPRKNGKYASAVAAPIFSEIASAYLSVGRPAAPIQRSLASVDLDYEKSKYVSEAYRDLKNQKLPSLTGLSLSHAFKILEGTSIDVELENVGRIIERQIPEAGASLKNSQRVMLRLRN